MVITRGKGRWGEVEEVKKKKKNTPLGGRREHGVGKSLKCTVRAVTSGTCSDLVKSSRGRRKKQEIPGMFKEQGGLCSETAWVRSRGNRIKVIFYYEHYL